jgi:hypothetical protein
MASKPITLTVTQPKPVATFNSSGSLQGSSYNPQPATPGSTVQNPTTKPIQGSTYTPQPANYNPQPAAAVMPSSAQVAATMEAARAAAAAEATRQREVLRARVQGEIDTKTAANKSVITQQIHNPTWNTKLLLGRPQKLPKIALPAQTDYDKAYAKAYWDAMHDVDGRSKIGHQNILQKTWDKVSFGSDRRQSAAREYAAGQASKVVDKTTATYGGQLKTFLAEQAKRKAAVEGAKYATEAQWNKAVQEYIAWETAQIADLEKFRASASAQIDAYGGRAQAPLTSAAAAAARWTNRNVVQGVPGRIFGNVWQYTLGQGSEHAPSVVTAPSRAVNFFGNLNTKDRTIYQEGGGSTNRTKSGKDAWESTFNQRSVNLKPWTDQKYSKPAAEKKFGEEVTSLINARKQIGETDPKKLNRDLILKAAWDHENQKNRLINSAGDLAFDPLNLAAGAGAAVRGLGWSGKIADAAKASKIGSWLGRSAEKVASNKVIQWLGAEHKTPEAQLSAAIDASKAATDSAQNILPKINEINKQIFAAGGRPLDVSVFEDLKNLSDSEAAMLQRMSNGTLSARDRLILAGNGYAPVRAKLEKIAAKWHDFADQMRSADDVTHTRFGAGRKKEYFARIDYSGEHNFETYNFLARKKLNTTQTADDLYRNQIDRYFKSNLDTWHEANQKAHISGLKKQRGDLVDRYTKTVQPSRDEVLRLTAKTRSLLHRLNKKLNPISLWKQSVLKFRPAWYLNNELYNTQAAVLAGGGRALVEKAKMLNPRYYRKVMDEMSRLHLDVKSNLAKEVGDDKLARLASRQENWSRVAAFKAAKAKGLTDEEALKRVNRYLFDYTTKNWERPLKAVVPFWQFQKNVAKASAVMPFDRPVAAQAYHRVDTYQNQQYDNDFNTLVPQLKKLGYSDTEIEQIRKDNAKYFAGKLKIGGRYYNTPFNAFSEKQMSQLGFNPFLAAAGETADSVDSFNQKVSGSDASWWRRLASKFPQIDLGIQMKKASDVEAGRAKPHSSWIGAPGSEGYGLTKEKQGYDKSKPNYVPSLDPRTKLGQNTLAFAGVPRSMEFEKSKLVKAKTLQKATAAYFALDTKNMSYTDAEAARQKIFKQYGLKADDFYKGVLAKYDTDQTKQIKGMKQDAATSNKKLFDEYGAQPAGTRNVWATEKLRQLVKTGYFDTNPFLKSFDWINPATVAKADKQTAVQKAVKSGDWSTHEAKYGRTDKAKARDAAVASGDWTAYAAKYGVTSKPTPFQYAGKFFKTADSMSKFKEGEFWRSYADADPATKKTMLAAHPEYNTRKDWTPAMWTAWKGEQRKKNLQFAPLASKFATNKADAQIHARKFLSSKNPRTKRVIWA